MMGFVKTILLIINIISFILVLVFVAFGVYEQITGPAGLEKLLKRLNVPFSYNQFIFAGIICMAITVVLRIAREKYFNA